ncbi:MAG: UDP-N-acetylmuramoyl-tripeptide--D-alanyl-D-alanine ligase [Pseudomonadota bacterium]
MRSVACSKSQEICGLILSDVIRAAKGVLRHSGGIGSFNGVSTDSRKVREGALFVCLEGERFDGHDFISQAAAQGAGGVLVRKGWRSKKRSPLAPPSLAVIEVDDTLTALGDIANLWRRMNSFQIIGLTGSSGKTTTKEMMAGILAERFNVAKTEGNLNNLIGMPLSLLAAKPSDEVVVLEMGMNRFGEIERLAQIADPDIGVITNVHPAHLEGLKTIEGVARAKGELFESLDEEDLAVFNADDSLVSGLAAKCRARKIGFGFSEAAEVTALNCRISHEGKTTFFISTGEASAEVTLPVPGRHNVLNALCASAVAVAMGVDLAVVKERLEAFRAPVNRLEILNRPDGTTLINDTYNANPGSVRAALSTLGEISGSRPAIAVLGDMLELGDETEAAHAGIGKYAVESGVKYLLLMGEFARITGEGAIQAGMPKDCVYLAATHEEIVKKLNETGFRKAVVLVKGSRRMRMEEVVRQLGGKA